MSIYPTSLLAGRLLYSFLFRGRFIDYLLDRPDVKDVFKTFVYHPFVMAMGAGTLPLESFKGYLIQDYLYLVRLVSLFSLFILFFYPFSSRVSKTMSTILNKTFN